MLALRRAPRDDLAVPLREAGIEVHVIGDARAPRRAAEAIHDGERIGRALRPAASPSSRAPAAASARRSPASSPAAGDHVVVADIDAAAAGRVAAAIAADGASRPGRGGGRGGRGRRSTR